MWSLGELLLPIGVPMAVDPQQGRPLHGPGFDVSRQGSGLISVQTWHLTSFSFCPVWTPALEGGTQVLVPSQPRTVWLQLGLRTLFFQSPPEMEFTSHLWSVHKLLQSICCVPCSGATEQKYTHDPGKSIFSRCLENSDSAECGHEMLIFNYFLKEEIWE